MADEQIGYIGHHAGVSMEQLSEISNIIGGIVTTILLPLLGVFMFYDQKKRKEEAAARKAEADNITSYAEHLGDFLLSYILPSTCGRTVHYDCVYLIHFFSSLFSFVTSSIISPAALYFFLIYPTSNRLIETLFLIP